MWNRRDLGFALIMGLAIVIGLIAGVMSSEVEGFLSMLKQILLG